MELNQVVVADAAIAIGIGLMIGLEREHRGEPLMGVRTYAMLALLGWLGGFLAGSWPWMPPVVLLAAAVVIAVPLARSEVAARGLTSEAAALVTVLLGMLVSESRELAVALAVVTTLLLISKPWVRSLVPKLERADLTTTLQLVVALAVVLPLLPEEARDPWGVLAPRRIGLFVTLILGVSWVGYVATRLLGESRGAGVTGLVGGLVSSTAVTAAMAQRARQGGEASRASGQLATLLACAIMSVRLLIMAAVIAPAVARSAAPAVGAVGLVMFAGAGWSWWRGRGRDEQGRAGAAAKLEVKNPTALLSALKWGLFMTAVLVAAALGKQLFGNSGVVASAAVSGLADVDAITLAVSRAAQAGELGHHVAVLSVVVAVGVNTAVKAGIAVVSGGRAYGVPIAVVFGASLVAGLALAATV